MDKGTVTRQPIFPNRARLVDLSAGGARDHCHHHRESGDHHRVIFDDAPGHAAWVAAGVSIRQTSDRIYGQIYVPIVNWLLMIATLAITIAFGSSDRLAGAYGTAVATTMLLTTVLLYKAMRDVWHWPFAAAIAALGVFLTVDAGFFCANLLKIAEGGWLPLSFAAVLFLVMVTWRTGIEAMHAALLQTPEAAERFLSDLKSGAIPRVDGTMVFLTRSRQQGVAAHHRSRAFYRGAAAQGDRSQRRVREHAARQRAEVYGHRQRWAKVCGTLLVRFGFFEIPDLRRRSTMRLRGHEAGIDFDRAVFVAARDLVVRKPQGSALAGWRVALFAFLYRNSAKIVDRFNLPPDRVIEIARQIEI